MSVAAVEKEIQIALHLDTIPNTPHFPIAISRTIRRYLEELPGIQIAEDHGAIYAYYGPVV